MKTILAHFIGLDEIHKMKLIKYFNNTVTFVDLDMAQQQVYNLTSVQELKKKWSDISNMILIVQKQSRLAASKSDFYKNKLNKLNANRNKIKRDIHEQWKEYMSAFIDDQCSTSELPIIILGFNVYPKDYRISIDVPNPANKWYLDMDSKTFASNQIKYYLTTHSDKIIRGTFPINLLRLDYLSKRYQKFTLFYTCRKYVPIQINDMYSAVEKTLEQMKLNKTIPNILYVATISDPKDLILVMKGSQIEGFATKKEAINAISSRMTKTTVAHISVVDSTKFILHDNKYITRESIVPLNVETVLGIDSLASESCLSIEFATDSQA
jgi:hypothetical protein